MRLFGKMARSEYSPMQGADCRLLADGREGHDRDRWGSRGLVGGLEGCRVVGRVTRARSRRGGALARGDGEEWFRGKGEYGADYKSARAGHVSVVCEGARCTRR